MSSILKMIRLEITDLLLDPAACSAMVERACTRRNNPMRVTGICPCGDGTILLSLEPHPAEGLPHGYRFAPVPDSTVPEIAAELQIRYTRGMTFLGAFTTGNDSVPLWGLYVRT